MYVFKCYMNRQANIKMTKNIAAHLYPPCLLVYPPYIICCEEGLWRRLLERPWHRLPPLPLQLLLSEPKAVDGGEEGLGGANAKGGVQDNGHNVGLLGYCGY